MCHGWTFVQEVSSLMNEWLLRVKLKLDFFHICRVIVGAPEDDSEQHRVGIDKAGAVYRCQTVMPYRCQQIPFDTSGMQMIS